MARTKVQFISASGGITELNNWTTVWALKGWNNFHNAPIEITSYDVPLQSGASYQSHRVKTRDVDLPLFIQAPTRRDFLTTFRAIVSALNIEKGEGRLRVHLEDGTVRDLYCRYLSGLEGGTNGQGWSPGSGQVVLTMRALDPFWYPMTAQSYTFQNDGDVVTFFPFFPLQLAAGVIFETQVINNPGDSIAWPIWTITGPCDGLTLTNQTSGYSLTSSVTLAAGETVVIDTRPGIKTVKQGTTNLFYTLSSTSVLWGFEIGNNTIVVSLDASTINSSVVVNFYPPYLSI